MTEPGAVHRTVEIVADPADVWELLIDDDERATWFGGETTLDPTPGGIGTFTDPDGTRRTAEVEVVQPERRLSWVWWEDDDPSSRSRVDVELAPTPGGTRVDVIEVPAVPTAHASCLTQASGPLLDLELQVLLRTQRLPAVCRR